MASSVSDTKKGGIRAFMQFLAVSVIAGVVSAGLAIPVVGVGTAGAQAGVDVFNALPSELDPRPLAEKSTIQAADGSTIAQFYWKNREEVPLDKISKPMQDATVAVEDYRFFEHGGVDLQGIGRALVHNLVSTNQQGGSTLTQQYVKNVLTEDAEAEFGPDDPRVAEATEGEGVAGYARKLREAKLAISVEKKFPKEDILNRYMNINNYSGSPRVYGVEAAAYRYWGIEAKDLDVAQAATLAGIVKNPSLYNPERNPEGTINRRNVVLGLMLQHGKIDQKEHDKAVKAKLNLKLHETPNGCTTAKRGMGFFCDYVSEIFKEDPVFGKTPQERATVLSRGGLTVKTSINPKMQKDAVKAIENRVPTGDKSGAGHTVVSVEPGTGKVLAMAQNRKYTATEGGKKYTKTAWNFNVPKQYNGMSGFQVGSTWKPFVLSEWLKEGHGLGGTVNANRRNFPAGSWKYEGCRGAQASWNPRNAGDGEARASMSALEATKHSVNTAYAAMGNQLNMCGILKTAEDLGVKYGNGDGLEDAQKQWAMVNGKAKKVDTYPAMGPSSILGVAEVAPIDMASAYAVFASGGTYCKPSPIVSIKDVNGKKVDAPDPDCHEAMDPQVAKSVAWALTQGFSGGTTRGLGIGVPAGAKTGTTNFEVGSTWLSGFTKKISTSVWTGNPDGVKDWRKNSKGSVTGQIFGATISGKTWKSYMSKAVKHTSGNTGFSRGDISASSGNGGANNSSGEDDEDTDDQQNEDDSDQDKPDDKAKQDDDKSDQKDKDKKPEGGYGLGGN
ncbi:transglycosylase domain-containing protein [Brevibacterium moorei]|uniref:transglycosylase domain-containing protein n=1 Tax=Brevibacterium moorei TaxID=2968457 RepID=UPI00211BF26D|nr:transglycosylase domain-containing protein [Brevibacterium sp. 68QC2CO]MCQ9385327.1 penicillin-binding protein [Brevibacterium sp. 68QC2CO]